MAGGKCTFHISQPPLVDWRRNDVPHAYQGATLRTNTTENRTYSPDSTHGTRSPLLSRCDPCRLIYEENTEHTSGTQSVKVTRTGPRQPGLYDRCKEMLARKNVKTPRGSGKRTHSGMGGAYEACREIDAGYGDVCSYSETELG